MLNTMQLLAMPILDFDKYKEDWTWDFFFHTPVLTPKFIHNKIGVDLIMYAGSEIQAKALLTQIAKIAKDYIFGRLPRNSRDFHEFTLSRDLAILEDYLAFQAVVVFTAVNTGTVNELYQTIRTSTWVGTRPYVAGLESAASSCLLKFRAMFFQRVPGELFRKGY